MIAIHRRFNSEFLQAWRRIVAGSMLTLAVMVQIHSAVAVGLVYVDADDGFTSGTPNLSPLSAINSSLSVQDNLWGYRPQGASGTSWESGIVTSPTAGGPGDENAPELTMNIGTANGLVSGASYDVYIAYVSATDANWTINAGLSSGGKTLFDRTGGITLTPVGGSPTLFNAVAGTEATSAVWTTAPSIMVEQNRHLLLGKLGTAVATGGQINVFIDDLPTSGFTESLGGAAPTYRTRLDGVAFVPAGQAIAVTATVNRTTGQITLSNPTGQSVQVASYSITSGAGALNPNTWLSIANNYDGNSGGSFDPDVWNITAPLGLPLATNTLSEAEDASGGNSGGALTAAGLNFGNAWIRTPNQDIQISLTLTNGSVISLTPQYTGTAISPGDLNADGAINLADVNIFKTNLHTNVAALTRAQSYQRGDMNGDLSINFADFTAFRTAYNAVNGAGAFDVAFGVPEPSTVVLLALGLACALIAAGLRAPASAFGRLPIFPWSLGKMVPVRVRGNMRTIRICVATCVAMIAILSLSAKANASAVTGWGLDTGGQNAVLTEGVSGSFSTTVPTGDARPRALLPAPITFTNVGDVIQLTGTVSLSSAVGNEQFRFGLFNTNGSATGTLSGGLWSGANVNDWLGYVGQIGDNSAMGADRVVGRALGSGFGWHSQTGAYQVGLVSTVGTTNIGATVPYNFTLKLRRTGATSVQTDYSFVGGTQNRAGSFTDNNLGASAATGSFNAVGFLLNAATGAGTFSNVSVDVPKELRLRVNTTTGAVSIANTNDIGFDINYYEIRSASGALNFSGWNSLDDQDPTVGDTAWNKAGGSSGTILSEFNIKGTKSLASSASVSLGNAFNLGGAHDLTFSYALPNGTLQSAWVEYVAGGLTGDYNSDGKVDAADYVTWRKTGINGAQGYTDWRANYGATSGFGSGGSIGSAGAVPEPTTIALFLLGIPFVIFRLRR